MAAAVAAAVRRRDELREEREQNEVVRQPTSLAELLPRKVDRGFWKYQYQAALVYLSIRVQLAVAGLIASNFLANIVEKWVDPEGDRYASVPREPFRV